MWPQQHEKLRETILRALIVVMLVIFSGALIFTPHSLSAGDWHEGNKGLCKDCHEIHSDKKGMSIFQSFQEKTLLCLGCHGSQKPGTSNVLKHGKAAGAFEGYRVLSRKGHDLGMTSTSLISKGIITFGCTTCHDPHGNDNYRNLMPNPLKPSSPGVKVSAKDIPGKRKYEDIQYGKGISKWCQTCHTNLYVKEMGGKPHHKVGVSLKTLIIKVKLKKPLSVDLPMDDPLGNTDHNKPSTMNDDTVNCITCHYAHGSKNAYALRYADGVTLKSTCTSCHVSAIKPRKEAPPVGVPQKPSAGVKQRKPRSIPK